MSEIKVKILPGLWTAECTESEDSEQVGKTYSVTNPYFKCEKLVGLYPGRNYEANLQRNKKIKLTKCLDPFPT